MIVLLYKIINDEIEDITPDDINIKLLDSCKRVDINIPYNDCYIFILFNNEPLFLRVGEPEMKIFIFVEETGLDLSYKIKDTYINNIDEGIMKELGHGIYYCKPNNYKIGNNIFECCINDTKIIKSFHIYLSYKINCYGYNGIIENNTIIIYDNIEYKCIDTLVENYNLTYNDNINNYNVDI